MRFQDIPGQTALAERFVQLHQADRLPHTLLLSGRNGYGTLALALGIAQYISCEHPGMDSCGKCKSCTLNEKLTHPDIHFSFPFISLKSANKESANDYLPEWRAKIQDHPFFSVSDWLIHLGGDNKQGNINAKEVSNILSKMSLKSFGGGRKILIIWMAEYLGNEGNKLLKLIEEPPENTNIILVAENTERLLSTILSRCQLFPVHKLSDEAIRLFVSNRPEEVSDVQTVVRLANGELNTAIALCENLEDELSQIFKKWMQCCFIGNGIETMKFINANATIGRESQKAFVQYGLHFYGEFMRYFAVGNVDMLRLTNMEKISVEKLRNKLDFENLQKIIAVLEHMHRVINRNANYKMLLLDATIKIHHYFRSSYSKSAIAG